MDRTTGRFYYIDHATKTTHWNPPTSLLQYQAELQRQRTHPPSHQPVITPPSQQRIAQGTPQIPSNKPTERAGLPAGDVAGSPSVSRSDKPVIPSVPTIDRTNKPDPPTEVKQMSVEMYQRKIANLQPVSGSPVSYNHFSPL